MTARATGTRHVAAAPMLAPFDVKRVTVERDAGTLRFTFEYWQPVGGVIAADAAFEIYTTSSTVGDPDFYTTLAFGPTRKALFSRGHQIVTDVVESTPNNTTRVLEVPRSSIGDPSGFRFIAFLPGENNPSGPYPDMDKLDLVPNSGFGQIGSQQLRHVRTASTMTPTARSTSLPTRAVRLARTSTRPIPRREGAAPARPAELPRRAEDAGCRQARADVLLDEIADVTVTGSVRVPGASKVYRIKKVTKRVAANKRTRIGLKLSKKARRAIKKALKNGQKPKAKLTVTAKDLAGQRTVKRPSVKLKR